ncbi:kinase-like protein [Gigaspora margarita]|uniref:Kinase-like protein n=1 Tax=Gigaspora margarita TaxID=4874 RepID=A0A8H4ATS9_GIGMA|nr:kinase-like protein [Gigaspora margarita]
MSNTYNTIRPVVPFLNALNVLVREVNKIYEDAECNKELCSIMTDRVAIGEFSMRRMLEKNDSEYYFQKYFISFKRFENVLINIKDFINKVSKLDGFRKFLGASEVKKNYEKLIKEFDTSINDLQFTIAVVNESQNQKVDESLRGVEETLKTLGTKLDLVVQSVNIAKNSDDVPLPKIDQNELYGPIKQDYRGSENRPVIKKFYKGSEVACRPTKMSKFLNEEIKLLGKLGQSPYILQFYGLSNVDNHDVLIFDWAENRTLKELYNNYHIPWTRKIQITRDICRGLIYLRSVQIFHHDVRCKNVFVLRNLDPKLGNFSCGRQTDAVTRNLSGLTTDIIHWMAPELINKYKNGNIKENTYTFNSEIFSFGMLIWELCYEKIPYEGWNFNEILNHVLDGKREDLSHGNLNDPVKEEILLEFIKIIRAAWKHISHERISVTNLHQKLEELIETYPILNDISLNKKMLNVNKMNTAKPVTPEPEIHSSYIPLEEGIRLHQSKQYKKAWQCFEENANLGNLKAKYWQGYYLYHEYGVVTQDIEKAKQLYKEAANGDHPDAQYRYAALLLQELKKEDNNKEDYCKEILHYFKLAANNYHIDAIYCMGDIYAKGKLQVRQNKELGLLYLRLAAENNHLKAIDLLKELETSTQPEPMDIEDVKSFSPKKMEYASEKESKILLLGTTGEGKSTFINRLTNHFKEGNPKGNPLNLKIAIPTKYLGVTENEFMHSEEDVKNQKKSQTKECQTYNFTDPKDHTNKFIFIDTPGLSDVEGVERDKENIEKIIKIILDVKRLSGIAIVANGTNVRLTATMKSTLAQLSNNLPDDFLDNNLLMILTKCKKYNSNFEPETFFAKPKVCPL